MSPKGRNSNLEREKEQMENLLKAKAFDAIANAEAALVAVMKATGLSNKKRIETASEALFFLQQSREALRRMK